MIGSVRLRAICLLESPRAISSAISRSRGDSVASGSGGGAAASDAASASWRKAVASLPAISALKLDTPRTARSMAAVSSALSAVFSR